MSAGCLSSGDVDIRSVHRFQSIFVVIISTFVTGTGTGTKSWRVNVQAAATTGVAYEFHVTAFGLTHFPHSEVFGNDPYCLFFNDAQVRKNDLSLIHGGKLLLPSLSACCAPSMTLTQ